MGYPGRHDKLLEASLYMPRVFVPITEDRGSCSHILFFFSLWFDVSVVAFSLPWRAFWRKQAKLIMYYASAFQS